nr:MAG TPA: cysteine protease [Caudoviricetes sp.]
MKVFECSTGPLPHCSRASYNNNPICAGISTLLHINIA